MLLAFVHNGKAFLPELTAYTRHFTSMGIRCEVTSPEQLGKLNPDVAWHFMGIDRQRSNAGFTIHEYTSASVPPAASLKNIYKRVFNKKPDYRLFLNDFVRTAISFKDDIPFGYRDMGVPEAWLHSSPEKTAAYDF